MMWSVDNIIIKGCLMKTRLARFFRLVAVPTFGVFLSSIGCSAADVSDHAAADKHTAISAEQEPVSAQESAPEAVAEEQEAMSAEEESVITDESALEESLAEGSLALNQRPYRGTCYYGRNCRGGVLARNVTARECGRGPTRMLGGGSWRASKPPGSRCFDL